MTTPPQQPPAFARKGRAAGDEPIAVAIKHEMGDIPVVVASGRGNIAEQILKIAFDAGIKVREDADLAQLLAAIELESPIPLACFEAVAEILSYIYRANADETR